VSKYSSLHVYSAFDAHCNMNCLKSPTFTEPFVCFSSSFPSPSSARTFMACKAPSLFPLCLNFLSLGKCRDIKRVPGEGQAKCLIGSTSTWHASFCLITWPWDITHAHNHSSCRECCLMWWYFLQSTMGTSFLSPTRFSGRLWGWSHYRGWHWHDISIWPCIQHYDSHSQTSLPTRSEEKKRGASIVMKNWKGKKSNLVYTVRHNNCNILDLPVLTVHLKMSMVSSNWHAKLRKIEEYVFTTEPQVQILMSIWGNGILTCFGYTCSLPID